MCWYDAFPAVKWFSNEDVSELYVGLECRRVDHAPPGESPTSWRDLWKLTRMIDAFPWL